MNIELVTAIISSSVLAASITGFINWQINSNRNKQEFFNMVLEKRLTAYELLNNLVNNLSTKIALQDGSLIHSAFSGDQYNTLYLKLISEAIDHSTWMKDDVSIKLTEINTFIFQNCNLHIDDSLSEEEIERSYHHYGRECYDQIEVLKSDLKILMIEELEDLYNVKAFIQNKKKNKQQSFVLDLSPKKHNSIPD